jgi:hypothetical protein
VVRCIGKVPTTLLREDDGDVIEIVGFTLSTVRFQLVVELFPIASVTCIVIG